MDVLKEIMTERLMLNQIEQHDSAAYFKLFSHARVMEYYSDSKFIQLKQAEDWIDRVSDQFHHQLGYRYAIRLKTGQVMGSFGVNRILEIDGKYGVLIGYELHPEHWQKGYMSEVLNRMLIELKTQPLFARNISFALAEVYPDNQRSIHLLHKHGFSAVESSIVAQIQFNLEISARHIFQLRWCA